ncbi:MAG TPA: hypothetical protein VJP59_07965 [Gemmatimonadota bacterium]|nr:hypothetical protein [Gemmatimonadota bacterium]
MNTTPSPHAILARHYAGMELEPGQLLLAPHHLNLARELGELDGKRRAWAIAPEDAPEIVRALSAGDVPWPLSGEWAGDMTPQTLAAEILGEHWDGWPAEDVDLLSDTYEEAFQRTYEEYVASLVTPSEDAREEFFEA